MPEYVRQRMKEPDGLQVNPAFAGILRADAFLDSDTYGMASQDPPTWNQITSLLESFKLLRDATGWAA
jgi:hypothetical protein